MKQRIPLLIATVLFFSGLMIASSLTARSQTETETPSETQPETTPQEAPTNPNAGKICLTEGDLPANASFVILGEIKKKKISYGSNNSLYPDMADEAREMGANAVIQVDDYVAPSWFAWAAPHLKGKAIKLDDLSLLDTMNCRWY